MRLAAGQRFLVPAGVVLRRDQHQARAGRFWLGLRRAAEHGENTEDYRIGGENSESNGSDDGGEENDGHEERDHDQLSLSELPITASRLLSSSSRPWRQFFATFAVEIEPQSAQRDRQPREAIRSSNRRAFPKLPALTLPAIAV